jgi:hypothetical protein
VAERQILGDAIGIGHIHDRSLAEGPATLGALGLRQVTEAGTAAEDFAGAGDFKPFGHGFLGFDAFWTSHNINSIAKERGM